MYAFGLAVEPHAERVLNTKSQTTLHGLASCRARVELDPIGSIKVNSLGCFDLLFVCVPLFLIFTECQWHTYGMKMAIHTLSSYLSLHDDWNTGPRDVLCQVAMMRRDDIRIRVSVIATCRYLHWQRLCLFIAKCDQRCKDTHYKLCENTLR